MSNVFQPLFCKKYRVLRDSRSQVANFQFPTLLPPPCRGWRERNVCRSNCCCERKGTKWGLKYKKTPKTDRFSCLFGRAMYTEQGPFSWAVYHLGDEKSFWRKKYIERKVAFSRSCCPLLFLPGTLLFFPQQGAQFNNVFLEQMLLYHLASIILCAQYLSQPVKTLPRDESSFDFFGGFFPHRSRVSLLQQKGRGDGLKVSHLEE